MALGTLSRSEAIEKARQFGARKSAVFATPFVLAALVFLLSLTYCVWQNPSNVLPRTTLYFDAGHYLDSCRQIFQALNDLIHGSANKTTAESVAYFLLLDGPVLPVVAAVSFVLQNKVPDPSQWFVLVQMQCVIQALCAALMFHLCRVFTKSNIAAVIAGLLWAAYPATVVSCGLFLTEPLACLLSMSVVAALHEALVRHNRFNFAGLLWKLIAGVALTSLVMLKAALIPAMLVVVILACMCSFAGKGVRATTGALLIVVLSGFLALSPWLAFTQYTTGKSVLVPSRRPVYNIATGLNIESDGWGCYPTHPVTGMFTEDDSGATVAAGLVLAHPMEACNLLVRKVTRFWSYPWNDFHYRIAGLTLKMQAVLQFWLVALAALGGILFAALSVCKERLSKSQWFIAFSAMGIIAGHLAYLPFEGIARYGYTATPFMFLLAAGLAVRVLRGNSVRTRLAVGLVSLVVLAFASRFDFVPYFAFAGADVGIALDCLLKIFMLIGSAILWTPLLHHCLPDWRTLPANYRPATVAESIAEQVAKMRSLWTLRVLMIFACVYGSASFCAFSASMYEAKQWECSLKPGMSAVRRMMVSQEQERPDWILALVDAGDLNGAQLSVNGVVVEKPFGSLYQYCGNRYEVQNYISMFGSLLRQPPEKLRQWRAVELDPSLLRSGRLNELRLTARTGKVTVYGDYVSRNRGVLFLPGWEQISPGKLFNGNDDDLDCRMLQSFGMRRNDTVCSFHSASGEENFSDLSNKPGVQTGEYRIFLLAGYDAANRSKPRAPLHVRQTTDGMTFVKEIGAIDVADATGHGGTQFALRQRLNPYRIQVPVPSSVLQASHVAIDISGVAKADGASTTVSLAAILNTGGKQDLASLVPGSPKQTVVSGTVDSPFGLKAEIPSATLRGPSPSIIVELLPGATLSCGKLTLTVKAIDRASLEGHAVKFF